MPEKLDYESLLNAWEAAHSEGVSRKQFADQVGLTEKQLDNRLHKAKKDREKRTDEIIDDTEDGNYRLIVAECVRISGIDNLLEHLKIDTTVWRIDDRCEVGSHEMGRRAEKKKVVWESGKIVSGYAEDSGGLHINTLFRYKIPLVRIHPIPVEPVVNPIIVSAASSWKIGETFAPRSGKALGISDMQCGYLRDVYTGELIPFHDRRAIDIVIQVAQDNDFDYVTYFGDVGDFTEFTDKFSQKPEFAFTTQPMLLECAWIMSRIRDAQPEAQHDWVPGNHEKRFEDSMVKNLRFACRLKPSTEIELDEPMTIQRMFGLKNIGVNLAGPYPNGEVWYGRNAKIIHGIKANAAPGATATNVVKDAITTTGFGHIHRIEQATKTIDDGGRIRYVTAFSPGCLCHIDYRVPGHSRGQNWQQGFGVLYYDMMEMQHVELIPIHDGKAIYGGKEYRGRDYVSELAHDTGYKF